ncbi:MAG: winged helix-turn-helix domain-containing protein [Kiritimatiellia bacterium]|jgi:DNA-binding transcriptional ArsR family regulator
MKAKPNIPVDALERVFHEPNRLAILSALCASDDPLSFTELKETCNLTDGNLNRHLYALEEDGIIKINKTFVARKPRTTATMTSEGLQRFQEYIDALGDALKQARKAAASEPVLRRHLKPLTAQ